MIPILKQYEHAVSTAAFAGSQTPADALEIRDQLKRERRKVERLLKLIPTLIDIINPDIESPSLKEILKLSVEVEECRRKGLIGLILKPKRKAMRSRKATISKLAAKGS